MPAFHHKNRPSILSSEADSFDDATEGGAHPTVGPVRYRGFLNAVGILLVLTNIRLIIENIKKYGVLVPLTLNMASGFNYRRWPTVGAAATVPLFGLALLVLEKISFRLASAAVMRAKSNKGANPSNQQPLAVVLIRVLEFVLLSSLLYMPVMVVNAYRPNPGANVVLLLYVVSCAMKLFSYVQVNNDLRTEWIAQALGKAVKVQPAEPKAKTQGTKKGNKLNKAVAPNSDSADTSAVNYPLNLTVSDMLWFLAFPTLCYQTSFPRTQRIRKRFIVKRLLELVVVSSLIYVIVTQYIVPCLTNALLPWNQQNIVMVTERVLKLAVPNLYVWLLGFYALFHVYLNIIAELTRFGDRLFYLEWWNSTTIANFWNTWNLPVHRWMKSHVFIPIVRAGFSRLTVLCVAFFISAVLHEFIVSVAFYTIGYQAFLGMLAQIPAVIFSDKAFKTHKQAGNIFFWITILLGQPLITLYYYAMWHMRPEVAGSH